MIAYVDSSVILRLVLGQAGALREWKQLDGGATSVLTEVECLRTLDRVRLGEGIADLEIAERRAAIYEIMDTLALIDVTRTILNRAGQPMPLALGTLDALHLASALGWRESVEESLVVATHDARLGAAARALGFETVGV